MDRVRVYDIWSGGNVEVWVKPASAEEFPSPLCELSVLDDDGRQINLLFHGDRVRDLRLALQKAEREIKNWVAP